MPEIITIHEGRRLRDDVVALGGVIPEPLTRLLDLVESVNSAPAASNPAAALIDAAVAGRASKPAEISKLVAYAARAEVEANIGNAFSRASQGTP